MEAKVILLLVTSLVLVLSGSSWASGNNPVKVQSTEVLTQTNSAITIGQGSNPVLQLKLKCVGGVCDVSPGEVQCYNRESDEGDVQLECKTDKDLEYKIEYTEEGKDHCSHQDYYQDQRSSGDGWNIMKIRLSISISQSTESRSSIFIIVACGVVVVCGVVGVALIMYAIYTTNY